MFMQNYLFVLCNIDSSFCVYAKLICWFVVYAKIIVCFSFMRITSPIYPLPLSTTPIYNMNIDGFDLHKFERHLNTYIHDIISLLKKNGTMTFEDIKSRTGIDLVNNYNLTKNLKNNQRIIFKDNTLSYKHTYQIKNKEDLISIISNSLEGIELSNLRDSPIDINPLLEEIKNKIIILKDNDNSEVVFYNDLEINQVDQDVRDLWIGIKVPPYQDLILQLNSAGLKKYKIQTKKKMIIKKDKNKKYKRKIKITNTHVKGLDLSGIEK